MVKPLRFKGDPKPKKRKRAAAAASEENSKPGPSSNDDRAADATIPEDDDAWVSATSPADVSGPIMIVLPTTPPTALACDALGKVYRGKIENMVDGIAASAEPHDVQMVWVANRIAGSEDVVRFKGAGGKFLSIDKSGIPSASAEVISVFESFRIRASPPASPKQGRFLIKCASGQYLRVTKSGAVAGDGEIDGDDELEEFAEVQIRMQARFKPQLQAVKAEKAREKISRKELEAAVGRRLEEEEVRTLKRARREGDYHERVLDLKVRGKHDKYG